MILTSRQVKTKSEICFNSQQRCRSYCDHWQNCWTDAARFPCTQDCSSSDEWTFRDDWKTVLENVQQPTGSSNHRGSPCKLENVQHVSSGITTQSISLRTGTHFHTIEFISTVWDCTSWISRCADIERMSVGFEGKLTSRGRGVTELLTVRWRAAKSCFSCSKLNHGGILVVLFDFIPLGSLNDVQLNSEA